MQVAYRNITISPDTLRVKVGTTVRWTNFDPIDHNVTSEGGPQRFASKDFGEGQTLRGQAQPAGDDPLRVHDPPGDDERDDRSRQVSSASPSSLVEAVA